MRNVCLMSRINEIFSKIATYDKKKMDFITERMANTFANLSVYMHNMRSIFVWTRIVVFGVASTSLLY